MRTPLANPSVSHRWDREIKEWVKMSPEEEAQAKLTAQERKKQDLEAKAQA